MKRQGSWEGIRMGVNGALSHAKVGRILDPGTQFFQPLVSFAGKFVSIMAGS